MSSLYQERKTRRMMFAVVSCAMLLTACTTAQPAVTLNLTASQRAPCLPPDLGTLATQAALDGLLIAQATAFMACAREKQGLVEAVDGFNAAVQRPKRKWWKIR